MWSLSGNNQADVMDTFNSTSIYQEVLLNTYNPYFQQMVGLI